MSICSDILHSLAEYFAPEAPSEIQQLKTFWCRFFFKMTLYGAFLCALVYFFRSSYTDSVSAKFLSITSSSGRCIPVYVKPFSGTYSLDTNGVWSTSGDYEPTKSLFIVDFKQLDPQNYAATMAEIANELSLIEPRSQLENLLLAVTWERRFAGGQVVARFDADAATFLDLPQKTVGFAGCPSGYSSLQRGDDDVSYSYSHDDGDDDDAPFLYELDLESGVAKVVVDQRTASSKCYTTRSGYNLGSMIGKDNELSYLGHASLALGVHLHSFVAAVSINYGLVEPSEFMTTLDSSTFDHDVLSYAYAEEPDYGGYLADFYSEFPRSDATDWSSLAEEQCTDFPELANPEEKWHFSDDRYPGMDPIVCVNNTIRSAGAPRLVCSVISGGFYIYPAIKFYFDKCNTCPSDGSNDTCSQPEGFDFIGTMLVSPFENGLLTSQPELADLSTVETSAQWGVVHTLGYAFSMGSYDDDKFVWQDDIASLALPICPLYWKPFMIAFNVYNNLRDERNINAKPYSLSPTEWSCSSEWTHKSVFETLASSSDTAPVELKENYFECRSTILGAFESALGIAFGNAELVFILVSIIFIRVGVRALGALKMVHFRNGVLVARNDVNEWAERNAMLQVASNLKESENRILVHRRASTGHP